MKLQLSLFSGLSKGERLLIITLLSAWLVSAPVLFYLYRTLEPSPDQSIWDYLAWISSQGLSIYRDSFEINWPGQIVIHSTAQWIFGPNSYAIRSFDYLLMQATAGAAAFMLWRMRARVASASMLAFYPPIYITCGLWMAGQRDMVAGEVLVFACLFLSSPRVNWLRLATAGALIAFAVTIRPTYLAFLFGAAFVQLFRPSNLISRNQRFIEVGFIIGGAMVTFLLFVLRGIAEGSLASWYDDSIRYVLECYGPQPPAQSMTGVPFDMFVRSWHWITAFAVGGAACWALRSDLNRQALILVIGALATGALSFVVQNKGYGYHLAGTLPFLVILFSVLIDTLARASFNQTDAGKCIGPWHRIPKSLFTVTLSLVLIVSLIGVGFKIRNNIYPSSSPNISSYSMANPINKHACEDLRTAQLTSDYISEFSSKSERVLPVNCGYHAAFLAQRLPASRYATATAFGSERKSCPIGRRFMDIYSADILTNKPALILVSAEKFDSAAENLTPLPGASRSERMVAILAKNYRRSTHIGGILIFRRNPHGM